MMDHPTPERPAMCRCTVLPIVDTTEAEDAAEKALLADLDPGRPMCDADGCGGPAFIFAGCSCGHDLIMCHFHARLRRREFGADPTRGMCLDHEKPVPVRIVWKAIP